MVAVHVFYDASGTGYRACIYVVVAVEKDGRRASLFFAKAKVAPFKSTINSSFGTLCSTTRF